MPATRTSRKKFVHLFVSYFLALTLMSLKGLQSLIVHNNGRVLVTELYSESLF